VLVLEAVPLADPVAVPVIVNVAVELVACELEFTLVIVFATREVFVWVAYTTTVLPGLCARACRSAAISASFPLSWLVSPQEVAPTNPRTNKRVNRVRLFKALSPSTYL